MFTGSRRRYRGAVASSVQPFTHFRFDIPVMATHDARGHLAWTLFGIIFFLRSLYSNLVPYVNSRWYVAPTYHTTSLSMYYTNTSSPSLFRPLKTRRLCSLSFLHDMANLIYVYILVNSNVSLMATYACHR